MNTRPPQEGFSTHNLQNGRPRILSVDDEPGILFTRRILLENAGFEVLNAADGEQAMVYFMSHDVDLVLLDYLMPGMNGGVVARKMRARKPQVPIVVISANPVEDDVRSSVDAFLGKGEGPALLLREIERLLALPRRL